MQSSATVVIASAIIAAAGLTACEQTEPSEHTHTAGEGHAPGEEHDHAPDEPGETGGGHDEGEPHDFGAATIGAFQIQATRYGDIAAGAETGVDITVSGDAQPAAIRIWIGLADARGSLKARADAEGDHYHAHVETPDPLPEGAALWIEVESAEGERSTRSLPLGG
jgi:hypothetical protein